MSDIRLSQAAASVLLGLRGIADDQARNALRLSTGIKVNSPLDNAPAFFKAAQMRGDIDDLSATKLGITMARTDLSLATTRAQSILKLLVQLQGINKTLPALKDEAQKHGIVDEMHSLVQQIDGLSETAEPDQINLLKGDSLTVGLNGQGRTSTLGLDVGLTVKTLGLGFLLDQPDKSDTATPIVAAPANAVPISAADADRSFFNPAAGPAATGPPVAGAIFVPQVIGPTSAAASLAVPTGPSGAGALAVAPGAGAPLPQPSNPAADDPALPGSASLPNAIDGNAIDTGSAQSAVNVSSASTASQAQDVQELVAGAKWGAGALGSGVTITYSFHNASSAYAAPGAYSGAPEAPYDNPSDLPPALVTAVQNALQAWANVANITFVQVADTATTAGDIRFGISDAPATSYAFYPSTSATGGDVWFGDGVNGDYRTADATNTAAYTYFYDTAIHELGHAIGLKHPHAADLFGNNNFDGGPHDSIQYTVMSYRDYVGEPITGYRSVDSAGNSYLPATPQVADIEAVQYLYGANTTYATGSNTYVFTQGQHVYQTIFDNGTNDTIDISGVTGDANLDLKPGTYSDVGAAPVVDVFNHANVFNHDNLGIAYGVNVKNALIGSGNDTVTGNDVGDNITLGSGNDSVADGAGADTISVGTGTDVIDGGAGSDVAAFAGNLSQYTFTYTGNGNDILVTGPDGNKTLRNVETAQFADVTVAIPTGLTIGGTPGTSAGPGAPSVLYVPSDALIASAIARAKSIIAELGDQQAQLGSRIEFNDAKVQVLDGGVDKLTLADLNDEGAAFAALQTRQQMATVALSIVSKQSKGLLQMFA